VHLTKETGRYDIVFESIIVGIASDLRGAVHLARCFSFTLAILLPCWPHLK